MLETILARTRADVERRRALRPLHTLREQCTPSDRDFVGALTRARTNFILEHKRASPSEGVLRTNYNPTDIARAYAPFAAAMSVLCDGPFFQGGFDDLRAIRSAVSQPVLCKDFVVDPYQVIEARANGADAILLMLSVLDDATYRACTHAAHEVGIATLTEVHNDMELARAVALGAPVIGINNRDLRSLSIDRDTTRRLAPRVPADRVCVSESGIRHHGDVRALAPYVDAFLVGSALMRAPDVALATRQLCVGLTKVCGLTRPADAAAAFEAGATHGGVIFAEHSPRRLSVTQAAAVLDAAPLIGVGVFVNAPLTEIVTAVDRLALGAVQLSGDESPTFVRTLREALPAHVEVWKAFRVHMALPDTSEYTVDRVLFDTFAPGHYGGTGARFDWSLLANYAHRDRVILAGGITPDNVAAAVATGVGGVDVNSGIEQAPGIKDPARIHSLFQARAA